MQSAPDIIDTRHYVFPLISIVVEDNVALTKTMKYLGTAFFVSKKGDAVTAAHVLPEKLEAGRILAAIMVINGEEKIYPIGDALRWEEVDFALFKVSCPEPKFFPIATPPLMMGTDVEILGISEHTTDAAGKKQMRLLKGYIVTLDSKRFELNFPVPAGMSGSPVLVNDEVVGYATGRVRSEELEDSYEAIEEISNTREKLTIIQSQRVTFYGVAHPFEQIVNVPLPALKDRTLAQFLSDRNS